MKKSNKDSFFEVPSSAELNKRIMNSVQSELELNRKVQKTKFSLIYLAPFLAVAVTVFLIYINFNKIGRENEFNPMDESNSLIAAELVEDPESFEIVDELNFIEDMEFVHELESGGGNA